MDTVGSIIKMLRLATGWSLRTLANKAGVSPTTLKKAEDSTDQFPRSTTWAAIRDALAEKLGISVEYIEMAVASVTDVGRKVRKIASTPVQNMVSQIGHDDQSIPTYTDLIQWAFDEELLYLDHAPHLVSMSAKSLANKMKNVESFSRGEIILMIQLIHRRCSDLTSMYDSALRYLEKMFSGKLDAFPIRPYTPTPENAGLHDPRSIGHTIPLRTKTAAGPAADYADGIYADRFLPSSLVPRPDWRPAAMVVAGDSMAPRFQAGDIIIIGERLQRVRTGDVVVVGLAGGEHTVKNLRVVDEMTWELIPTNPNYPTIKVKREEIEWYAPVLCHVSPMWTRREVSWDSDS